MAPPPRIASLLASATEILYGIGLGDQVVAVSHECDYPVGVEVKPQVTYSHVDSLKSSSEIDEQVKTTCGSGQPLYSVDENKLRTLRPDLIVTQAQCDVCAVRFEDVVEMVRMHDEFSSTQVVALNPMSLEDVFQDIKRVGAATNSVSAAQSFVDGLRSRVSSVRSKTVNLTADHRPRVACFEWIEPLMLGANWMPELVELAGGRHGLTKSGQHSTQAEWEDLVGFDPELIVVMPCGFDLERTIAESQSLPERANWQSLQAVRNGRVFAVDGNAFFNRSGPRLVDSLEILAHLIHPDRFDPPQLSPTPWIRL